MDTSSEIVCGRSRKCGSAADATCACSSEAETCSFLPDLLGEDALVFDEVPRVAGEGEGDRALVAKARVVLRGVPRGGANAAGSPVTNVATFLLEIYLNSGSP